MSDPSQFVLALDQGTTSSRAILFDHTGAVVGVAQREFEQIFPRPGLVEHSPAEIWNSQIEVAREVLREAGTTASAVCAVGITNQRETTLLWDRSTGEPVANAIVWQDRRTADRCARLVENGHADTIRQRTGLVPDAYFSATKLEWLLDHVDGARARARAGELAFGTVDSWLIWKLSGGKVHATDVTNASRTMLWNIETSDWDDALLELFRIPRSLLPEVHASSGVIAHTESGLLGASLPVGGVAGDQQAALFGQMCRSRGSVKNTYGTGCFLLMNIGERPVRSRHDLVTTVAWKLGDRTEYALEGSVFIAGAVVQWLRDGLGLIRDAAEIEALARQVDDNGGVYLVPAFAGLGAPHWDPYARGVLAGITRGTSAAHVARAALEGIAFQVADVVDAMRADSGLDVPELRVDGGASSNALLMQIQSDVLGVPILRPTVTETTALGAAYLAGLAVGYWGDVDEIAGQWQVDRRFEPSTDPDTAPWSRDQWRRAVERSRGWLDPGDGD